VAETIVVARLGHRGDGIADTPAGPLYVAGTLAGERVEVDRTAEPGRARLLRVIEPAAARVTPYCPHVGECGGCAVQHLAAADALAWKRSILVEALRQQRIEAPVEPCIDAHGDGRRRATLHARPGADGRLVVGFSAARTHDLVELGTIGCPLLVPGLAGAVEAVRAVATVLRPLRKPLDALVTATLGGIDLRLRGPGRVPEPLRLALVEAAARHDLARLSIEQEVLVERRPPMLRMGAALMLPPPGVFLQATEAGEAALAALVSDGVGPARLAADLFSGCGTFALRLATRMRVHAAEADAPALAALERTARATAGLKPVTTERRDLFRRPLLPAELTRFDAVIFDPPRAGADAQAGALAQSRVRRVVAVSCNAATLAHDLRILLDGGYRLDRVTPVDQFRHAAHIESVAVLSRP
jgi:23S rRNA (uracil1939-C5)-methyltransferase